MGDTKSKNRPSRDPVPKIGTLFGTVVGNHIIMYHIESCIMTEQCIFCITFKLKILKLY